MAGARGLLIAAARSGAGKTTATLALLAAFRRRGIKVAAAKCGPDYIDPAFHAALTGRPVPNLDSWAMSPALLHASAAETAAGAELLIVEAAMGLFDGIDGEAGRCGTAADVARTLGLPVVLLLDVGGQAQTAAAVAQGLCRHDPSIAIAGVLINRCGSERHRTRVARALAEAGIPFLGSLARDDSVALPSRHLGLVQAEEQSGLPEIFERLAALAGAGADLDALLAAARPLASPAAAAPALPPPGQRIALARDHAFSFVYAHLIEGWRRAGAEILPFSPLADEPPDPTADCCWLPGGYPELHAARLAAAGRFRAGLRRFAESRPVHGECGGYMVLGDSLEDAAGATHAMVGLLGHRTSFARRRLTLGYRRARLLQAGPLGEAGTWVRGHEFHYASETQRAADEPLVELQDGEGAALGLAGARRGRVTGSFFHVLAQEH
ncbi:MAG TPA: cobyrinate a,c-diamide synthase [Kiloniellales bacterium]|nr:cobyrinate a,c-diamide synthase [Kiloniellales bacterium]